MFIILMFILIGTANAVWVTKQYDLLRYGFVPGTNTINTEEELTNFNFTCGTGDGTSDIQPIIKDIDNDGHNELITFCSGDSSNAQNHLIILDNSLEEIDAETVTDDTVFSMNNDGYYQFDIANIDDDENYEIIIYHPHNVSGSKKLELIVYEYNISKGEIIFQYSYAFLNNTIVWNDTINVSDMATATEGIHLECEDSLCFVHYEENVMVINISEQSKVWYQDLNLIHSGYDGLNIIESIFGRVVQKLYPFITNIDLSGNDEYCALDNEAFICLDYYSGSLTHNFTLDISAGTMTIFPTSCTASRCETDRMMLVVNSRTTSNGYCEIYDSQDGDRKQITKSDGIAADYQARCWIEDRDDDGNDELCFIGFGGGLDNNQAVCEELNLFETDTLRTTLNWTTTASSQDNNFNTQMVITDYNQDGYMDVITDSGLWSFNNTLDSVTLIDSVFLNDSVPQTGIEFGTVVSEFFEPGILNIISVPTENNFDTYYISASPQINFKIQFTTDPYQSIQNPICQNELLSWSCSYANGCVSDAEFDEFKMGVDCFSDGTQIWEDTRFTNFGLKDIVGCDLSETNLTGYVNATFWIWDEEHEKSENETRIVSFFIASENQTCFNATNPGDVTVPEYNTPPQFVGIPSTPIPSPFCLDSVVIFDCLENECYDDAENNSVYLKIDCDDDDVFEEITFVGDTRFACHFETAGSSQINLEVCDIFTEVCDGLAYSVTISTRTAEDVIADGIVDCGDEYLFSRDTNQTVIRDELLIPKFINGAEAKTTYEPFCVNTSITFTCNADYCYKDAGGLNTTLLIDCNCDNITDDYSVNAINHEFQCSFNETENYTTVCYQMRNSLNLIAPAYNQSFEVTDDLLFCVAEEDAQSQIYAQEDGLTAFFHGLADLSRMELSAFALLILVLLCAGLYWMGVKKGNNHAGLIALSVMGLGIIVFTILGIITWLTIVLIILFLAAYIAYRIMGG